MKSILKFFNQNILALGSIYISLLSYLSITTYYRRFNIQILNYLTIDEFILEGLAKLTWLISGVMTFILLLFIAIILMFILQFLKNRFISISIYIRNFFSKKQREITNTSDDLQGTISSLKDEFSNLKPQPAFYARWILIIFFLILLVFFFHSKSRYNPDIGFIDLDYSKEVFFNIFYYVLFMLLVFPILSLMNLGFKQVFKFYVAIIILTFPGLMILVQDNIAHAVANSYDHRSPEGVYSKYVQIITTSNDTIKPGIIPVKLDSLESSIFKEADYQRFIGKTKLYYFYGRFSDPYKYSIKIIPSSQVKEIIQIQ